MTSLDTQNPSFGPEAGRSPETDHPATELIAQHVEGARACISCAYDLNGLPVTGKCPECGRSVEESLKGMLLQHAAPEYIRKLLSGHSFILNGILLQIVVSLIAFLMAAGLDATQYASISMIFELGGLGCSLVILYGYVLATEPDLGFAGSEKPIASRKVVRIAALVQVGFGVAHFVLNEVLTTPASLSLALLAEIVPVGGSLVAWSVQFFAMLRYTRWIARRIPDAWVVQRTRVYMYLLPLLATVGAIAFLLGPFIVIILYWRLLDRMRTHLKSIEKAGVPAALKGIT